MRDALVGAADGEPAVGVVEVVLVGLEQVRGEVPGLVDDLVDRLHQRLAADHERARAVGVEPAVRDLGVAVQHLDVLERHAEPVGDDLAERRLVALAVGARAGDDLDLAGGEHPHARVLPAAGAVVEAAQHPARRQAAHLGEGRDADAELHPVSAVAPLLLLRAQRVVAEGLLGLRGGRPRSCRSRTRGPATVVNGNSSCVIQLRSRISSGSTPTSAASSSINRSMAYVASGRPAPR